MNTLAAINALSLYHASLQITGSFLANEEQCPVIKRYAQELDQKHTRLASHVFRESFAKDSDQQQAISYTVPTVGVQDADNPFTETPVALAKQFQGVSIDSDNLYTAQCILEDIMMNEPEHKELNDPAKSFQFLCDILFFAAVNMDTGFEILCKNTGVENNHCWDFEIVPRAIIKAKKSNKSIFTMTFNDWSMMIHEIIKECDDEDEAAFAAQASKS